MPRVTGRTTDNLDIVRRYPSEGCHWRCTTCGNYLRRRSDVRGHWAQFSEGHSFFEKVGARLLYHRTVEGLHRRMMTTERRVDD